jgi:hypothetical protein
MRQAMPLTPEEITMAHTSEDRADSQARAQVESIIEMVAALQCDYSRLEELREEQQTYVDATENRMVDALRAEWAELNPDAAAELVELESAAGECTSEDEARERIQEDALSIEVRAGWHAPGETGEDEEFRILLCTGGPHVEIVGELDEHKEPDRVRIIFKDWGTSGELFDFDHDAVLAYCRCFYFGE